MKRGMRFMENHKSTFLKASRIKSSIPQSPTFQIPILPCPGLTLGFSVPSCFGAKATNGKDLAD
jgi:hypothetical protein